MKIPKIVSKMSLDEQEAWLSKRLKQNEEEYYDIKKLLGIVRGGMKIQPQTEERPDLEYDIPKT